MTTATTNDVARAPLAPEAAPTMDNAATLDLALYGQILASHHWQEPVGSDEVPTDPRGRFVLVQESRVTGLYWIDFSDTLQGAIDNHDSDEYPEDWLIKYAVDLATGERYKLVGVETKSFMEKQD
jgi:hypothetical protein